MFNLVIEPHKQRCGRNDVKFQIAASGEDVGALVNAALSHKTKHPFSWSIVDARYGAERYGVPLIASGFRKP
jgi:hypothetical protein